MYGEVVDGSRRRTASSSALAELKDARGVAQDVDLAADDLARARRDASSGSTRRRPATPSRRTRASSSRRAVRAVFDSWDAPRAQVYRRTHDISGRPRHGGQRRADGLRQQGRGLGHRRRVHARPVDRRARRSTASSSPTRRARTSSPGIRTPRADRARCAQQLPEALRAAARDDPAARGALPRHAGHRVHGRGRSRSTSCRRAPASAPPRPRVRIAVDMVEEGLISREEARRARSIPAQLDQLLHPMIDPDGEARGRRARPERLARARPPARSSSTPTRPQTRGKAGETVILVRWETTPDDVHGMVGAKGILTAHGGMTSHAAVVARGMGKPCVAGCEALTIDAAREDRALARPRAARGRHDHDRRRHRRASSSARSRSCRRRSTRTSRRMLELGRRARAGCACARTPTRPPTPPRRASSAPRGSASAAPSTCSSAEDRLPVDARDDPGRRRGRAAAPRSSGCCRSSRPTSRASSRRWRACR